MYLKNRNFAPARFKTVRAIDPERLVADLERMIERRTATSPRG